MRSVIYTISGCHVIATWHTPASGSHAWAFLFFSRPERVPEITVPRSAAPAFLCATGSEPRTIAVQGVCPCVEVYAQDHRLVRCSACMFVSSPPSDGKAAKVWSTIFAVASGLDCRLTFTKGHCLCSAHRCSSAPSPAGTKTSVNEHS